MMRTRFLAGIVGSTKVRSAFRVSVAHRVTPMTCCADSSFILQLVVEDFANEEASTATAR